MKKRSSYGISMIEILVSIVIISVGLLGVASLQLISLKNVNNTQYRTLATLYVHDMAERMRSNRAGVAAGAYDAIDGTETDPACSTNCTAVQIAQYDAFVWNNNFIAADINSGGLPSGVGTVNVTTGGGTGMHDISVSWQEQSRDDDGGLIENKSFTLTVKL